MSLKSVENFVLSNSKFIVRSVERFNIRMQNESDSEKFFDGCVKRIFGEDYILSSLSEIAAKFVKRKRFFGYIRKTPS